MVTPEDHTGFRLKASAVRSGVLIPKYYDPEIGAQLSALKSTHQLISIGTLIGEGHISVQTGDEIGKMAYGTGTIPFVRTSDISNWEIKTDPKQGVSAEVYNEYRSSQDVRAGDILFVRDGTYLIGSIAVVTEADLPLLFQSHILKIRVNDGSPISPWLLMACLSTSVVKRQVQSKRFTADIIDTIGERYREIILPVPISKQVVNRIVEEVKDLTSKRSKLRDGIKKIPHWIEGGISSLEEDLPESTDNLQEDEVLGFSRSLSKIRSGVFIPKYYDPGLEKAAYELTSSHNLVSLAQLIDKGTISWSTGIEVGKMAYGTGPIPFIRTSDISNWELKGDPKQAVSEEIYQANKQDVREYDILLVRDGTYLVGTSCILTAVDTKILFCGGLYKFRVEDDAEMSGYLLLALLNSPFARRQMRSKQFTRDIIDTLGKRVFEVILPVPKHAGTRAKIGEATRNLIEGRAVLRDRTKEIALEVTGT